jgi:acetyltransferase-like isoleucine patch superfamily enzyme
MGKRYIASIESPGDFRICPVGKTSIVDENVFIGKDSVVGNFVYIEEDVTIGKNCFISHYTHLRKGVKIGDGSQIRNNCLIEPYTVFGKNVMMRNHCSTAQGQIISDNCYIGPHVSFTNANVVRSMTGEKMPIDDPPYLEENVTVFTHAVILSGVRLAKGCVIGAGAVVTKDTEAGETYMGVPARKKAVWADKFDILDWNKDDKLQYRFVE